MHVTKLWALAPLAMLLGISGAVQYAPVVSGATTATLPTADDDDDGGDRDDDDDDNARGRRGRSTRWPAPWPTDRGRRDDPRRGDWARGIAQETGYYHGLDKGREDADRNRSYSPQRHRLYREADSGFDRRYGSREAYRDRYREGFREGYDAGHGSWERSTARRRTTRSWPWPWPF